MGGRRESWPEDPASGLDPLQRLLGPTRGEGSHNGVREAIIGRGSCELTGIFLQVACGPVGHQVVSAEAAGRAKDWLLFLDPECQS